jgi:hypothetical protein
MDTNQQVVIKQNNYEILFHLTTLIFVVLKLSGTVDWSWWLVLLPSLVPVGGSILLMLAAGLLLAVAEIITAINELPANRKKRQALKNLRRARLVEKIKNEK